MWRAIVVLLVGAAIVGSAAGCGSSGDGDAGANDAGTQTGPGIEDLAGAAARDSQTIMFEKPDEVGDDPFTEPADIEGDATVEIPDTPFGGSGSDKVCDRDKLIRFLKKNPDRMRAWARVLGIEPTYASVSKYISKLHPVTLSRDTQVTNHYFANGEAVPFQAILQAGTAVLVDKYGRPVARCRCGNPLTKPVYHKEALCPTCPPNYRPPKQCPFYDSRVHYDKKIYRRDYYSNADYDRVFIRLADTGPYAECWIVYPKPPVVTIIDVYREPPPEPEPDREPAQPDPQPDDPPHDDGGLNCDAPSSQLEFEQCRDLQHPPSTPAPEEQYPPMDDIPPEDDPGYVPPSDGGGGSTNPDYPPLEDCNFRPDC